MSPVEHESERGDILLVSGELNPRGGPCAGGAKGLTTLDDPIGHAIAFNLGMAFMMAAPEVLFDFHLLIRLRELDAHRLLNLIAAMPVLTGIWFFQLLLMAIGYGVLFGLQRRVFGYRRFRPIYSLCFGVVCGALLRLTTTA